MPYRNSESLVLPTLQNMVEHPAANFLFQRDPEPKRSTERCLTTCVMIFSMQMIGLTITAEFGKRLFARMTLEELLAVPSKYHTSMMAKKDRFSLCHTKDFA